jgi:tetratricopeptide (TPR) repeat protein
MANYKCPTLGDCTHANAGEIFERSPGEDLKCPGCGTLLNLVSTPDKTGTGPKPMLIAAAAAVVVALAGGGYFFMGQKKETPLVVEQAVAPASAPTPAQAQAKPAIAPGGIAPSEAEIAEQKKKSELEIINGNAASAEQASNKAATNEMIKLAIAKMTQGKLDEAEKDLNAARERDPKQPLVSYNMAVLRLKQGRQDDAIKEFEASYMAGFSHFDRMDQDRDLDVLRKDARFTKLVDQYRNQQAK